MKKTQILHFSDKFSKIGFMVVIACIISFQAYSQQSNPPLIPVGLDAYRMWDQWPTQRIGARAYMRCTYDRAGHNEGADASHFLFFNREEDNNVTLDIEGKGILYFKRTNHWHGSPWRYVVDGNTHIIRETATSDPVNAKQKFDKTVFIPEQAFPSPLIFTWSTTHGADLMWVPIGFEKSFQLAYGRTRYGTGYYIYHHYANEKYLSQPIRAWDPKQTPDKDVLDLLNRAGTDIAPQNIQKETGKIRLNKNTVKFAEMRSAPSSLRALKLILPLDKAEALEQVRLRVTWDGRKQASIDAPLCLFFGAGTFYNRDQREYLVKGFPLNIRFDYTKNTVELSCYYPMPFFKSAKFELYNITPGSCDLEYELRYEPYKLAPNQSSYFHATYKDFAESEMGKDLVLLDTRGIESVKDWSGNFVGTSFIFTHDNNLGTLEGDPRFFFDDSQTPQAQGTGTEEWGGGGDYWGGRNMTLPFAGHPCRKEKKENAKNEKDMIHSAYRFLLADLMPFGNRAVIGLEHGGENLSTEHYETVTYWYGLPAASLIKTDELNIGDLSDEKAHDYVSLQASAVETIVSRYEWGIDSIPQKFWNNMDESKKSARLSGREVYPSHTENGRYTKGSSEFTLKINPDNRGIMLRRTLDYSFPNQKAEVYVADVNGNDWKYAGIWYLAGSNTCIYSNPPEELDFRLYNVQTSNRRFRDDEFLITEALTQGKSSVRIRIKHVPVDRELYPGRPFPKENAWSELRYQAYSFVIPNFK
jgi:hypothetical protein